MSSPWGFGRNWLACATPQVSANARIASVNLRTKGFPFLPAACAAFVLMTLAGCGGDSPEPPPTGGAGSPGAPAMLSQELKPGEVMVEAEASPQIDGPYRFDGRYRVRFVQYAPEAPGRSFGGQT